MSPVAQASRAISTRKWVWTQNSRMLGLTFRLVISVSNRRAILSWFENAGRKSTRFSSFDSMLNVEFFMFYFHLNVVPCIIFTTQDFARIIVDGFRFQISLCGVLAECDPIWSCHFPPSGIYNAQLRSLVPSSCYLFEGVNDCMQGPSLRLPSQTET
jgi:hypothetical protein